MYSTLCSPQPSDVVFVLNVDVMFNRKPSESVNIGSSQDTTVFSSVVAIVIFSGHRIRSGFLLSGEEKNTVRSKNNLINGVSLVLKKTS